MRQFTVMAAFIAVTLAGVQDVRAQVAAPFGDYPNCIAPSIPLEQHGWWHETGDAVPRHMHIAACLPAARDLTGDLVSVSGIQPFTVTVTTFSNPDALTKVRWSWQSSVKQEVAGTWQCPGSHVDHFECQWDVPMVLNTLSASNGLRELRLTENTSKNAFGKRMYGTLNFQLYVRNGAKKGGNYRKVADPIARSWYGGFNYANVQVNYMDLFSGGVGGAQLDRSVPLVSGIVTLKIKHDQTSRAKGSELWLDADFHRFPHDWTEAVVGAPQPSGATLLYRQPGLFVGTYELDTTTLSNGRHALYFQTTDRDKTGLHATALKVFIDVEN